MTTLPQGESSRWKVARAAGVSPATVSLALNNHPRVRAATRQRVLAVAAQLDYVPDRAAQRLIRTRYGKRHVGFDQVGFLCLTTKCPWGGDGVAPGYLAMMHGAEEQLFKAGACLTFVRIVEPAHWDKVTRLVRAGGVDGWLVTGAVDDEVEHRLRKWQQPFVVLGDQQCARPLHAVDIYETAAGRLPVERLATQGHRRIARVGGELRYLYQRAALAGHRAAVRELGLDVNPALLVQQREFDEQTNLGPAMRRLEKLLALRPTALVVSEPSATRKIMTMLRGLEVEIPAELSVVGCELQQAVPPPVGGARVELPFVDLGREAATLLQQLVARPRRAATQLQLPPRWVAGWSCAANGSRPIRGTK